MKRFCEGCGTQLNLVKKVEVDLEYVSGRAKVIKDWRGICPKCVKVTKGKN